MSTRAYRTVGLVLIVAAIAAAVAIQFLGGGLVEIADLRHYALVTP